MSMRNRFFSKVMAAVLICAAFVPLNIALAEEKEQAGPGYNCGSGCNICGRYGRDNLEQKCGSADGACQHN